MTKSVVGVWRLTSWRRLTEGQAPVFPFGDYATGLLIYASDGRMAVQMAAADRPKLGIDDALGGPAEARAAAYSTCLAYFGSYAVEGTTIVHHIEASLFPDWSGKEQARPFTLEEPRLVLRTPEAVVQGRAVVNEMSWIRAGALPPTGSAGRA